METGIGVTFSIESAFIVDFVQLKLLNYFNWSSLGVCVVDFDSSGQNFSIENWKLKLYKFNSIWKNFVRQIIEAQRT